MREAAQRKGTNFWRSDARWRTASSAKVGVTEGKQTAVVKILRKANQVGMISTYIMKK